MSDYTLGQLVCLVDSAGAIVGLEGRDGREWAFPAVLTVDNGATRILGDAPGLFDASTGRPVGMLGSDGQEYLFAGAMTLNTTRGLRKVKGAKAFATTGNPALMFNGASNVSFGVAPTPIASAAALLLDFTSGTLDSRITFTRASIGTRINAAGLIETVSNDVPRFDYDPVTLQPKGLLIEEQRTNLLLQSGDLSNASWATKSGTFTANAAVAPDGTTTATSCVATSSDPYVYQSVTLAATTYTMSVWIKGTGVSVGKTGTIRSGANASPAITITNAWQRITYTFTATAGAVNCGFEFPDGGTTATGDTVYYWGAQLEAGAFATSYIPTVASTVTRAVDSASMTGTNFSSWFNATEGTLYADLSTSVTTTAVDWFCVSDGTTANRLQGVGINDTRFLNVAGSVISSYPSIAGTLVNRKTGSAYSSAGGALSVNGSAVTSAALTAGLPTGLNQMQIGANVNISEFLNGTIKRLAYYNRRLSNAELQTLTA